MPRQDQSHPTALAEIRNDICDLQRQKLMYATLVQVPRDRVRAIAAMSDQELREVLQEFIKHDEIDAILNQIRANDLSWFTQIALGFDPFPVVRIKVAAPDEDDCKEIALIQGKPIYPMEPGEESYGAGTPNSAY